MLSRLKYLGLIAVSLLLSLVFQQQIAPNSPSDKVLAQTPTASPPPASPRVVPPSPVMSNNEKKPPSSLPWLLVSRQPNAPIPLAASTTISSFLTTQGLTPISCSSNQIVIISINDSYLACVSPNATFPPGNYSLKLPDL